MNEKNILLTDQIELIEKTFKKDGWVTVYESSLESDLRLLIFCCLTDSEIFQDYRQKTEWIIEPEREGKPSVASYRRNNDWVTEYNTHFYEGLEPFLFVRDFNSIENLKKYVDISEEFVLYFKLYEKIQNKQNRVFYYIDENGDLDEVIKIVSNKVTVKLKYLMEYISVRKMHFTLCYFFDHLTAGSLDDFDIASKDEQIENDKHIYSYLIRDLSRYDDKKIHSSIYGKAFINFDESRSETFHFEGKDPNYESYLVGYDDQGDEIYESCKTTEENYLAVTHFKKEVLDKYYNDPTKYTVDSQTVRSNTGIFILPADNDHDDYVAVFLGDLSHLPAKEQLHWKHYNIPLREQILSDNYYQRMLENRWVESPETPDFYFKWKYKKFNQKWESKFGWRFYKPLAVEDEYNFTSLHIPTGNNVKTFGEQLLAIVKLTIDRLNEKEFEKQIVSSEPGDKGLTKLEKYLAANNIFLDEMMEFLRHLQNLRSGLMAHGFSNSNKACQKAMKYFGLPEKSYKEVAGDIFSKSILTLHTLDNLFDLETES